MATKIVPIDSTYDHFSQTVELDGTVYTFEFKYNPRDFSWYFDLSDNLGNLLVGSIPAIIGWPLLRQYKYDVSLPPGILYFLDQTDQDLPPARYELGQRVVLVYEESASA